MSANHEESKRALEISQRHESSNNYGAALRFARKALVLSPSSTEAKSAIARLEKLESTGASSSGVNPNASGSTATPRASTSRAPPPEPEKREYTQAQVDIVKRVRACKVTSYYDILGLKKTCEEVEVKKAYRKLALSLHPDKCGAPGAEEAFKMVSKAFQVLSDSNKREVFDQTGGDPDSRGGGGGGGGNPMAGFARRGGMAGPGGMDGELSPEDLFQFFFGGGGGGASFGGGGFGGGSPAFQFYGPGGVNFASGGPRRRAAPNGQNGGQQGQQGQASGWLQVAPLLILFAFSLLTQLPSLFGSTPLQDPDFSWTQSHRYSVHRRTTRHGIDYFVNPVQFAHHPIYKEVLDKNPSLSFSSKHEVGSKAYEGDLLKHFLDHNPPTLTVPVVESETSKVKVEGEADAVPEVKKKERFVTPYKLEKYEVGIERSFAVRLQQYCQNEIANRHEQLDRARGFFGIGADWEKVEKITKAKLEHCERLSSMGYQVNY